MTGRLTTHVLDTSSGFPAKGIRIVLYSIKNDDKNFLKELGNPVSFYSKR